MASKPWIDGSNAGIARALRNDSEALRYAEWWVRRKIYGLEDAELRWLRDQYVIAYEQIINNIARYQETGRTAWAARELAQIERELDAILDTLMQSHSARLNDALPDGWRQGYYGRVWLLDSVTVEEWSSSKNVLMPTEAIRAALVSPYIGRDGWINLKREALVDGVKRSVVQGLINGESMLDIRARLARELGVKPGQTKNFKAAMYRTLLITRTEVMRASNLGALAIYEQNQDVISGWEWVATLDERTCLRCGQLDGKVFYWGGNGHEIVWNRTSKGAEMRIVKQPPPSGSHGGCRCTGAPVLRDTDLLVPELKRPRVPYPDWAQLNGVVWDGGLIGQRASDAHGLNRTAA